MKWDFDAKNGGGGLRRKVHFSQSFKIEIIVGTMGGGGARRWRFEFGNVSRRALCVFTKGPIAGGRRVFTGRRIVNGSARRSLLAVDAPRRFYCRAAVCVEK